MIFCTIVGRQRNKYKFKSEGVNVLGSLKFKPYTLNSRVFSSFRILPPFVTFDTKNKFFDRHLISLIIIFTTRGISFKKWIFF